MIAYYAQRAAEYEQVYEMPRWQDDLAWIRTRLPAFFAGRRVFEVACGTGYWTRVAAERAKAIHASDVNDDTLALARAKRYAAPVTFERRDAYAAAAGPARHDAGNRYEMRRLANGEQRFEIVKNLLDRDELTRRLAPHATELVHRELRCFWVLEYRVG